MPTARGFRTPEEVHLHIVGEHHEADVDQRAAVLLANDRNAMLERHGATLRAWHPTSPGSPCVKREHGIIDFDWQMTRGWFDHCYRLTYANPEKHTVFVSEPYQIHEDALVRLSYLAKQGWRVTLRPEMAIHYPGRTTAIWIERAPVKHSAVHFTK